MTWLEICENCGNDFAKLKSSMRFCSRSCQREALARQDRAARALYQAARKILFLNATGEPSDALHADDGGIGCQIGRKTRCGAAGAGCTGLDGLRPGSGATLASGAPRCSP